MSESSTLSVVQVELGKIRDMRRAGIKISKGDEEILTLTYVPNSAIVIIMDGTTYAQGLGLVNQIGTPLEKTIYDKINAYLGMKGLRLDDKNLGSLLKVIEEFNDGSRPINDDNAEEIKEKGARAKKVFTVDLGRTILSIDVDYKFSIDDGFGNSKDFVFSEMIIMTLKEKFERYTAEEEFSPEIADRIAKECLSIVLNWSAPVFTGLNCAEAGMTVMLNAIKLFTAQIANHKALAIAEKKKAEREEKEASKEPKKAPKKDVIYCMVQDKIATKMLVNSERYGTISLPGYGFDYEAFILEIIDPIYRCTQRKAVKESIEIEGKDDQHVYLEYGLLIDKIIEQLVDTGKIDAEEPVNFLNAFFETKGEADSQYKLVRNMLSQKGYGPEDCKGLTVDEYTQAVDHLVKESHKSGILEIETCASYIEELIKSKEGNE